MANAAHIPAACRGWGAGEGQRGPLGCRACKHEQVCICFYICQLACHFTKTPLTWQGGRLLAAAPRSPTVHLAVGPQQQGGAGQAAAESIRGSHVVQKQKK